MEAAERHIRRNFCGNQLSSSSSDEPEAAVDAMADELEPEPDELEAVAVELEAAADELGAVADELEAVAAVRCLCFVRNFVSPTL